MLQHNVGYCMAENFGGRKLGQIYREQTFIWQKTLQKIQACLQAFFQVLQAIDGQW